MNLVIVHGGQTGVDRGAHEGAIDNGWSVAGVMPKDGCDERGPIPADVYRCLSRCTIDGLAVRTEVNLDDAHAVLVVVPDSQDPYATPGTRLTLVGARKRRLPRLVAEPSVPIDLLAKWVRDAGRDRLTFKLMVAGPRESRWASGRVETAALLRRLALADLGVRLVEAAERVRGK
jgi:hypothetical protein